ncbi:unnamed protein product, partial [Nesidiocoris tenuis]
MFKFTGKIESGHGATSPSIFQLGPASHSNYFHSPQKLSAVRTILCPRPAEYCGPHKRDYGILSGTRGSRGSAQISAEGREEIETEAFHNQAPLIESGSPRAAVRPIRGGPRLISSQSTGESRCHGNAASSLVFITPRPQFLLVRNSSFRKLSPPVDGLSLAIQPFDSTSSWRTSNS